MRGMRLAETGTDRIWDHHTRIEANLRDFQLHPAVQVHHFLKRLITNANTSASNIKIHVPQLIIITYLLILFVPSET